MSSSPSVRMGELAVAKASGQLRTLLGSCVGLALYDRAQRVAGLAHVALPASRGPTDMPGKFVDTAVPELLELMARLAGRSVRPTARLAGGANMFATETVFTIGQQNVEASELLLRAMEIPIVGSHCGGEQGRRLTLDAATGHVTIELVGQDPVELSDRPAHAETLHG
jgi:chemotaxis protein CheD